MRSPASITRWQDLAILAGAFAASRLALHAAGLPFDFSLDWMWLGDPADLEDGLVRTIFYFHAFPPGMNALTGLLLKMGGAHASALALIVFRAFGLVLVWSLFYLLRAVEVPSRIALVVAAAFSLLPQSLYFEHLYLYETPVAALLCLSVALFHAALTRRSSALWLVFFSVCALIGLTRATFHLAWFGLMLGAALACRRHAARRVLAASAVPAVLLLALYVKNGIVFGTFGALTYGPAAFANVTVWRLPPEVRSTWIGDGRLSPAAAISPYAGPTDYVRVLGTREPDRAWPAVMTRLDRPSVHAPNFNHWAMLGANRQRTSDAWRYVSREPLAYLATATRGLRDLFSPTTEWHPYTGTEKSPHHGHRRVLGAYEDAVNGVVHGFPLGPVGLYALLPMAVAWTGVYGYRLRRAADETARARGALLWLCLLNVVYVVAASSAFTFLESSRYRFQIEPLIWVMATASIAALVGHMRGRPSLDVRHPAP
jgi:hypothetical protein